MNPFDPHRLSSEPISDIAGGTAHVETPEVRPEDEEAQQVIIHSTIPIHPSGMHLIANARRQNVACDGCRAKKVKCGRESIEEKCPQCIVKGVVCTSVYVESIQNKPPLKRLRKAVKDDGNAEAGPSRLPSRRLTGSDRLGTEEVSRTSQDSLLRFLFSAEAVRHHDLQYSDLPDIDLCRNGNCDLWESQQAKVYEEEPSEAHRALHSQAMSELADDLLETYASIVHIRFPIMDMEVTRARFSHPDSHPAGPLSHALLAIMLAFGARFSDHPVIASDKEEMSRREMSGRTRSRIVQLLIIRAREVCEARKIHRIVTEENCVSLHLLESLLGPPSPGRGLTSYHADVAGRQAISLGFENFDKVLLIPDEAERMRRVLLWWIIGQSDGWRSLFGKSKPMFNDDDFCDIGPLTLFPHPSIIPSMGNGHTPSLPETSQEPTLLYFTSSSAYASICRRLYHDLYTPRVRRTGISTASIRNFVHSNSEWHDKYIGKLGVPEQWPDQWNFHAAISSCSTDTYHHILWVVVHQAIQDLGLEDERNNGRGGNKVELDSLKRRIAEESERSSLRIASLANVLTENGYLRLDPMILLHPIYMAGLALAKAGRSECRSCIAGLKQYSIAYGLTWDMAEEIERSCHATVAVASVPDPLGGLGLEMWSLPGTMGGQTAPTSSHFGSWNGALPLLDDPTPTLANV